MPFGIQPIHLLTIGIVALIIFGPARLPELGRGLGRSLTEFRKGMRDMTQGFHEEVTKMSEGDDALATGISPQPQPAAQPTGAHVCPACGVTNPADARFCNKCGTPVPV